MKPFAIKINGTIKEVIEIYNRNFVPMNELVTDYLEILSNRNELIKAVNPWAHLMKSKDIVHVRGVSVEETVFIHAAMKLKNQLPTDVIRAAFYRGVNNDLSFEMFFVVPSFISEMITGADVLVVNPSPDMILKINSSCNNDKYYIEDQTICSLYNMQFNNLIQNDFTNISPGSNVVYTSRDTSKERVIGIIDEIIATKPKYCKFVIPASILDVNRKDFFQILGNQIYVDNISIIPTSATRSISRKKIMINLTTDKREKILLTKYRDTDELLVKEDEVLINYEDYINSSITTNSIYENKGIGINSGKYNAAEIIDYSKEIRLYINIFDNRHGMFSGVGYYKGIKDVERKLYGTRISPKLEKGMRGDSREEVLRKASNLVYDVKFYDLIVEDVHKNYIRANKPITIKTLFFLCVNELRSSVLMDVLEDERLAWLGNSYVGSIYAETVRDRLVETFNDINVADSIILQLNKLMKSAIRNKLIDFNPFLTVSEISRIRQQQRINSLRRVLVKKHLDSDKEWDLIGNSITKDSVSFENSYELSFVLRYFTGISIRELCALRFKDFKKVGNHKSVMISRVMNDDGNETINYETKINKLRLIPLPDFVSEVIDRRVRWIHNKGLKLDRILDMHLLMDDEKGLTSDNFLRPNIFLKYNNNKISKLGFTQDIIIDPDTGREIDFNMYNGDIVQTNYRYHILNDCGFERNEINHVIGNVQQDTFSIYYCDFNSLGLQLRMIRKLNRWINRINGSENQVASYLFSNKDNKTVTFEVDTTCGAEVEVVTIPKE